MSESRLSGQQMIQGYIESLKENGYTDNDIIEMLSIELDETFNMKVISSDECTLLEELKRFKTQVIGLFESVDYLGDLRSGIKDV